MTRVLHLLHSTDAGGVQAAAEQLRRGSHDIEGFDYSVGALADVPEDHRAVRAEVAGRGVNSPLSMLRVLAEVRRSRPDVLVTSLWRVVALAPIARLLSPGTRWVIWVHLDRYTHAVDRVVHRWALPRADAILSDSAASTRRIVDPALARTRRQIPVRIIRPVASAITAEGPGRTPPTPEETLRLAFWGRLASQKRIDLAIELCALLAKRRPGPVQLVVAGPDSGEQERLLELAAEHPMVDVRLPGPIGREAVSELAASSHAFVQLSDAEGYAMSAHEALAAGMLCVVTPAGDLRDDARDGVTALVHHGDLEATADRLLRLLDDPPAVAALGAAAAATASGPREFVAEFARACRETSSSPRRSAVAAGADPEVAR